MLKQVKISTKNCNPDVGLVLSEKMVYQPMKAGAFIAGGFARVVAHNVLGINELCVKEYLTPNRNGVGWDRPRLPPGDVDIFSPASIDLDNFNTSSRRSFGDFAAELACTFDKKSDSFNHSYLQTGYTIQLVDHPKYRYKTVEECLGSFDITNSKYAIILKDNAFYLVYDEEAARLDKQQKIDIQNTTGPFLASRVLKYLNFKHCNNGITQGGYEKLTEWFARAAVDQWPDHFHGQHLISIRRSIDLLQSSGYMKKEDLVLFLGKWKERYAEEKYGPTVEVDWAVQRISE